MTSPAAQFLNREIPSTLSWLARVRLTAGAVVSWLIFLWVGKALRLPDAIGLSGTLFGQPSPAVALGAMVVTLIVCTVLNKFIVGDLEIGADHSFEGGLMAANIGMFCAAFRMGPVRYALFQFADQKVFPILAAELFILYAAVVICWLILKYTSASGRAATKESGDSIFKKLAATSVHAVVMIGCMVFLAQSEASAQGLAAVGISAWLAAMAAHFAFPVRGSFWYWISPMIVGALGYGLACSDPVGVAIGFPSGTLGELARPTPLAYAAAGPVGAIWGYWIAYRWNHVEAAQAGGAKAQGQ